MHSIQAVPIHHGCVAHGTVWSPQPTKPNTHLLRQSEKKLQAIMGNCHNRLPSAVPIVEEEMQMGFLSMLPEAILKHCLEHVGPHGHRHIGGTCRALRAQCMTIFRGVDCRNCGGPFCTNASHIFSSVACYQMFLNDVERSGTTTHAFWTTVKGSRTQNNSKKAKGPGTPFWRGHAEAAAGVNLACLQCVFENYETDSRIRLCDEHVPFSEIASAAIRAGKLECLRYLREERKIYISAVSAARFGQLHCLAHLCPNRGHLSVYRRAVEGDHVDCLQFLQEQEQWGDSAFLKHCRLLLEEAAWCGSLKCLQHVVNQRGHLDDCTLELLPVVAAENGHLNCLMCLQDANIGCDNMCEALHAHSAVIFTDVAATQKHCARPCLTFLHDNDCDMSRLAHLAADCGNWKCLDLLMDCGWLQPRVIASMAAIAEKRKDVGCLEHLQRPMFKGIATAAAEGVEEEETPMSILVSLLTDFEMMHFTVFPSDSLSSLKALISRNYCFKDQKLHAPEFLLLRGNRPCCRNGNDAPLSLCGTQDGAMLTKC